eukprot:scaffold7566_cov260-Ochromonas_danica.AAC.5
MKCQKLFDSPEKVKKFFVDRQFFVIFVVFLISEITTFQQQANRTDCQECPQLTEGKPISKQFDEEREEGDDELPLVVSVGKKQRRCFLAWSSATVAVEWRSIIITTVNGNILLPFTSFLPFYRSFTAKWR